MTKPKGSGVMIDAASGLMECAKCGRRWCANQKPHGHGALYRGAHNCPNCEY